MSDGRDLVRVARDDLGEKEAETLDLELRKRMNPDSNCTHSFRTDKSGGITAHELLILLSLRVLL